MEGFVWNMVPFASFVHLFITFCLAQSFIWEAVWEEKIHVGVCYQFFYFFSAPCSRWQVVMLDIAFDPQISGMFCLASPRVHGYTKWSFHAVSPCIYRLGKYGLDLGLKKLPGGCSLVAVVISVFWCGIDFFPRISVLGHISCSSVLVRTASALDLFSALFSFFHLAFYILYSPPRGVSYFHPVYFGPNPRTAMCCLSD